MLLQLHWQNPRNISETQFIAQYEVSSQETMDAFDQWSKEMVEFHMNDRPEGWIPMVCTEDSDFFERAASEPTVIYAADN